ncbi:MAG: hypothetical protein ACI4J0_11910 [Huintestinicola sp.]|uniref:hypothetical protein n=1 Tax=Huintestinicola sp. TaxID=2981661 RepID=UPI003F119E64
MDIIKKTSVIVFLLIIFLPMILMAAKKLFEIDVDVELKGYTDKVESKELTFENFVSGEYQSSASQMTDKQLPLRGIYTKTYNTLRYNLFNEARDPMGKDHYIISKHYILSELNIGNSNDFSIEENQEMMEKFVGHLSSVQKKLDKWGKKLYIYIIPSKAHLFLDKIPENYVYLKNDTNIYSADLFRDKISATDVKALFCEDYADQLNYPTYYASGVHWSRIYEQTTSQRIIKELNEITGKNYRNMVFTGVEERNTPFWRDADVWDLANVWNKLDETFYQYSTAPAEYECYDNMHLLLYGDSFAEGFIKDVTTMYPDEEIYFVSYNNYIKDPNGDITRIDGDWGKMDFNYYLDNSDAVVIELVDSMIKNRTNGFIENLDAALDNYVPGKVYMSSFDGASNEQYNMSENIGVYEKENGFVWVNKEFSFTLQSPEISNKGLFIRYVVPGQVFDGTNEDMVTFYVNGEKVAENVCSEAGAYELILTPDMLEKNDNHIYTIFGKCSNSFVPKDAGLNDDARELALRIEYLGEAK